ncbi:phage tail tube protein [Porphyromonas endodontalis]|uniref:phage tail tube protein n=1 Tax=Porphyromonas endodontalis TaxID=28124 RepID=UPI0028EA611E|nr:phage tail tube protein [Porphyromonas endodontalis]
MSEPAKSPATPAEIVNGSSIMLFVGDKPTLVAKSHKISYKSSTESVVTKDVESSLYAQKMVKQIDVTISVDAFVAVSNNSGIVADDLVTELLKAKEVTCKYGKKDKTGKHQEGKFIIDSIDITSQAGERATYSATLSNTGPIVEKDS